MMKKFSNDELSDAELEELGIEISEEETDASFFDEIDKMIAEIFEEDAK